jgi:hypothetical protein
VSGPDLPEGGKVRRAVLEVEVEGRVELVSVSDIDGELKVLASDGSTRGPHVETALRALALGIPSAVSDRPSSPGTERPPPGVSSPLADSL